MEIKNSLGLSHQIIYIGILCLLVFCLGIPSLLYPFGRDQGEYATIARAALDGKVVYRDIFNVKPPMTHIVHQIALLAFGEGMISIRILDLLWHLITSIVSALIAWRLWEKPIAGLLSGALYSGLYFSVDFWNTAQTDGFLTLPIGAGVLVFISRFGKGSNLRYVLCGVLLGIGASFKYPIGIIVVFLMFSIFCFDRRNWPKLIVYIGFGFLIPIVVWCVFLISKGSFLDFLEIQISYFPSYSSQHPAGIPYWVMVVIGLIVFLFRDFAIPMGKLSFGTVGLLGLISYGVIYIQGKKKEGDGIDKKSWMLWIIGLWWFASFIHLGVQNKFYEYHKLPILAPSVVMITGMISIRKENALLRVIRYIPVILLVLTLLNFMNVESIGSYNNFRDILLDSTTLDMFYADPKFSSNDEDDYSVSEDIKVSEYIKTHTSEDDEIFIWGFEPTIYFLSGRNFSTKYIYNYPLFGMYSSQRIREDFLTELMIAQPINILVVKGDVLKHVTGVDKDSYQAFLEFDLLNQYVSHQYKLAKVMDDFYIFHRK